MSDRNRNVRPLGTRRGQVGGTVVVVDARPAWRLHVLWDRSGLTVHGVEPLRAHPGLVDAGRLLAKRLAADIT